MHLGRLGVLRYIVIFVELETSCQHVIEAHAYVGLNVQQCVRGCPESSPLSSILSFGLVDSFTKRLN